MTVIMTTYYITSLIVHQCHLYFMHDLVGSYSLIILYNIYEYGQQSKSLSLMIYVIIEC